MNKFEYKKLFPFKWFVLENFPFIEEDFDAITNWQLFCKLGQEINKILNSVNTLGTQVEDVTNAFIELQNYVNNYFENLDVQDEINNKLDEMAQDGTLQEIISSYINLKSILAYNTVADMKQATNLIDGSFAKTYGFYSYNDGGGALYKIRTVTNQDNPDNMTLIPLANTSLVAEYVNNKEYINPLEFGAKGDGVTDDTAPIQKAINLNNVKLARKSYNITQPIEIPSNRTFDGNNATLIPADSQYALTSIGNGINSPRVEVSIKDVQINTSKNGGNGIRIKDGYFIYIDNVNIIQLVKDNAIGFDMENGFNHVIKNSRVYGNRNYTNTIGLYIHTSGDDIANATNNRYETLLLQNLTYGVKTEYNVSANMVTFENIGFSNNDYGFYIDGYALPLVINNTRMESILTNGIGFYIGANAEVSIDSFNAYNIPNVIKTISSRALMLKGSIALTGTSKDPKYYFVDPTSTGAIRNLAYFVSFGNVYYDGYSLMTNNKNQFGTPITDNNVNMSNTAISIFEITGTTSLLNIFGKKGSECYVWTKNSNLIVFGSANSMTNKWSGSLTLEPYKMYHFIAVEDNQIAVVN